MKQTKRIGEVYNVESICITKDDLDDVSMRRTVCSNLQRFFVSLWAMAIRRTTIHTISHMQNRKATETVISENCSMCLENEIKSQNNEKYNRTKKKRAKIHFYLIANSHWNDDLCQSSAHLVLNRVKQRKRTENVVAFNYILLIKTETNKRSSCICVCVCAWMFVSERLYADAEFVGNHTVNIGEYRTESWSFLLRSTLLTWA